jgi:glycosyltransferase involved in cell wall biosynthesis
MVSRLTALKRADLLLEALATPEGAGIRAVIGGEGEERPRLEAMIDRLGLQGRVVLAGALSEGPLVEHLARCRAVCFPPLQEDYGFVTAEAFASRKAVVTCRDSGGPAELVRDGVNGFVCDPTPASLAASLRKLMEDRSLAERLGAEASRAAGQMTWADAVKQLMAI